ncbi:DUF6801 domain-containing protein [Actinocorallia sp. B10E7]|uniref:DUF6801 domain-containing protein n=1 Tax=Actinocorallia sp. B10E7 TaxID=3153558 RepID=UPI00325F610B
MRIRMRVAGLALAATGAVCVTGPAAADPVTLELRYRCNFPLIPDDPVMVRVTTDLPRRLAVGERMPPITLETADTVSAYAAKGLTTMYAATLEGTADASATLTTPDGMELPLTVPNTLEKTEIPKGAEFTVKSRGSTPGLVFDTPGEARITVGDLLLKLTPREASGELTGLGAFESECVQDPGQNDVLAVIQVGDDPGPGGYTAEGSTFVKAGSATLPLTGTLDGGPTGGTFNGNLALNRTTGTFKALGFLPVVADAVFTPTGALTGTLAGEALSASVETNLSLPSARLFGLPLSTEDCRTSAPTRLDLKSPSFTPAAGGTLTAAYALPALTGCGLFTPLINGFTAGQGNTISLTLKPA